MRLTLLLVSVRYPSVLGAMLEYMYIHSYIYTCICMCVYTCIRAWPDSGFKVAGLGI